MWPYRTWVSSLKTTSIPSWPSSWAKSKPAKRPRCRLSQGFQLVQVVDRKDAKTRSFEEAAPQIREMLMRREMEKTFKEWMKGQRDRSVIKIMN